jgi:2-polyprenyl-3-methyl-5-hydroxy-6-metoxy-1,4-benzoquinol methylase
VKSWNDLSGDWQGLTSETQAPRYQAIARMINQFCPVGSVLDVGCGEAVLSAYLPKEATYFGIEPSAKAGESAVTRCGRDCILNCTGEDFDAGKRRWDCVVFNEVLYYSRHPVALLDKYSKLVKRGGIIIVSIYQKRGNLIKTQLMHWLDRDRPMSNVYCTRVVHSFMFRRGWRLQEDTLIAKPGSSEYWRIWSCEPRRP